MTRTFSRLMRMGRGCTKNHDFSASFFRNSHELKRAKDAGIKSVTITEFKDHNRKLELLFEKIDALRRSVGQLYVSLDVDGIDQQDAPGTPMRNPDGFTADELRAIAKHLRRRKDRDGRDLAPIVGIEVAEYSPTLDTSHVNTTGNLVRDFIGSTLNGSTAGKMAPIQWITVNIEGKGPTKLGYY